MRQGIADKKGRPLAGEGILRLTLVLGAVMAIGPLAIDMYLPALPTIGAEFRVEPARVQHTLSAYLLGLAIGQLVFGPIADRYGRKRPLQLGLGLFAIACAGCALAQNIESFVVLRFAQALGGASGMVVIRAIIRDRFNALQSAHVLSLMLLVMGVAPILAPLAGGYVMLHGSWHWIFWFLAVFAAGCVVAVAIYLEESHAPEKRAPTLWHALAGFGPIFSDRRFIGPLLVFCCAFACFFAYLATAPFVYIQYFGVPAHQFGWYFGAGALGFISVSQVNRRLISKHGPRRVLGWGVSLLAGAAALLLVCSLTGFAGFWGVFIPVWCFIASVGLIASNATAVAMEPFGSRAGGASSLLGSSQSAFGVLASAAVGWIPASGAVPMATVIALCAAIAFTAYFSLVRTPRSAK